MPNDDHEQELTRKERREQARSQRKEVEEMHAVSEARKRRLTILAGVVVVVVVVVVIIAVAGGGGKSTAEPTANKSHAEITESQEQVNETLAGTKQAANVLGDPNAPVTLQYFGDLECPICREFTLGALPDIIKKWVKTGKVKIEYRSLSTATGNAEGDGSEPSGTFKSQQAAALAAGKQDKMWDYVELFYHQQGEEDSGYVTEDFIKGIAKQIDGLDLAKWEEDRKDPAFAAQIEEDANVAAREGFTGTPSFLIGKSGATPHRLEPSSLTEAGAFDEEIEKLLKA
ncbi:MAG TPA: thioredoxin domain-containing protein [Solirubrobacteraceae bacterium]|nr:thioredoxin domain-containing protein [Solirubrobacteraceae bacterium]